MLAAGAALTVGAFKYEASNSKQFFCDLLEDIETGYG
jgi:hypothetical protein